jgi:hypothetical protein
MKMILRIENSGMTNEDLVAIGKFLLAHFAKRRDMITVFIEGQTDAKIKECEKIFNEVFKGNEYFVTRVRI